MLNEGDDVNPEKKIKDKLIFNIVNIIIVYSLKCLYFQHFYYYYNQINVIK